MLLAVKLLIECMRSCRDHQFPSVRSSGVMSMWT